MIQSENKDVNASLGGGKKRVRFFSVLSFCVLFFPQYPWISFLEGMIGF